jgi:hypothetical protein
LKGGAQARISALALLAANLVPLLGVLFWGWPLGKLLALYWAETAVLGVFNIFRMLMIQPLLGLPLSLFFAFHFGMFMFVHGVFLTLLVLRPGGGMGIASLLAMVAGLRWEVAALVASHGVSFFVYWILGDEKEGKTLPRQMMAPYGRVVVMHLSILFGGAAVTFFGQPGWMLALFIALKTGLDLRAHLREHRVPSSVDHGGTLGGLPGTRP